LHLPEADSTDCHTIFVCRDNIRVINFGVSRKIDKKTIILNLLAILVIAAPAQAATHLVPREHIPNEIIVKFRQNVADFIEKRLEESARGSDLELFDSLDKLNAKYRVREIKPLFKNFRRRHQWLRALQQKNEALLDGREKQVLRRLRRAPKDAKVPNLASIYKIRVDLRAGQSLQEIVEAYKSNPDIEYAELNYIISINLTPNDPLYFIQWPLNNTGQIYPESGKYNTPPGTPGCDIDAPEAWDIYTGNADIIVAVVDSGVDYRHRDLDDNMWINSGEVAGNDVEDDDNGYVDDIYGYDFINSDSDPCDDHGHGTHCAGTIAAEGDNGLDVAGVCWDVRIMALKFLGYDGYGSTSDAVTAFYYAVANGADVTSNSWGGGSHSETMREAIDYAHSQGVIMVASAGNDNSDYPKYPAYYEHMISVAATNSNDEKAPFSNYGDWVDIAAPGVDILSLRAEGTYLGTNYDDYITIASGTSMSCPHIAGACALLLSANPLLTCDEVYDILIETVDPISPGICASDGRLNLHSAIAAAVPSQGYIILDRDYYACSGVVSVSLVDYDLRGQDTQAVNITTTGGDSETLFLNEDVNRPGIFMGTISIFAKRVKTEDGKLQVAHDQIITAIYEDANDGTGNPATVEDTAVVDCEAPLFFNVEIVRAGTFGARIRFETNEPTTGRILCDLSCGEPYAFVSEDAALATAHTFNISGLSRETSYYFIVDAFDAAGNQTTDDNSRACYSFTTGEPGVVRVPSEFPTIQAAVNDVWQGDTVLVADGNYTGPGNRDIDFKGKAITVRSENGPENCIIDCNSISVEPYRGFYFHSGEDANSVVEGFTITNGYAPDGLGGGIKCVDSSPTLTNCTFSENLVLSNMYSPGGGMSNHYSSPTLINCTFTRNSGYSYHDTLGGGMYNYESDPTLTNCAFIENSGSLGGGIYNYDSNSTLINCTFTGNSVHEGGGAIRNLNSNQILTNCTFIGNFSDWFGGGGMDNGDSTLTLTNCIFSGNWTEGRGGGMQNAYGDIVELTNCTFQGNLAYAGGGIYTGGGDSTLNNCIFTGNTATDANGGGMYCYDYTNATLSNCTFAENSALNGNALVCDSYNQSYPCNLQVANCIFWDGVDQILNNDNSVITITYSDVQGGWAGPGGNNINIDPDFVDATNPDPNLRDYRLRPSSFCIDVGDNNSVPPDTNDLDGDGNTTELLPWDLDGHLRFADGDCNNTEVVDMGAYEFAYAYIGDFDGECDVDMVDFAILASAWLTEDGEAGWNPDCDISIPADNSVNMLDLAVFVEYWLAGK
jgi:subtilisin family serine protease